MTKWALFAIGVLLVIGDGVFLERGQLPVAMLLGCLGGGLLGYLVEGK